MASADRQKVLEIKLVVGAKVVHAVRMREDQKQREEQMKYARDNAHARGKWGKRKEKQYVRNARGKEYKRKRFDVASNAREKELSGQGVHEKRVNARSAEPMNLSGQRQVAGRVKSRESTGKRQDTRGKRMRSTGRDERDKSQEPRAKSQEPRAKSQEQRAKSQEPRAIVWQ
jgi:hypothetical protein